MFWPIPTQKNMRHAHALNALDLAHPPSPFSQLCALVIADDGLTLRWEDESKAMQASLFLAPALFSQYDVPWATRAAGVRLHPLVAKVASRSQQRGAQQSVAHVLRVPR